MKRMIKYKYCLKCRKKQKVKTRGLQRQIKKTNILSKLRLIKKQEASGLLT